MAAKYSLEVTETQLRVIRDACEVFGRVQIGQFDDFAQLVCRSGLKTEGGKLNPDAEIRAKDIENFLSGVWRQAGYDRRERSMDEMIALDIWAVLDGRRKEDSFCMGSEPNITVKEA